MLWVGSDFSLGYAHDVEPSAHGVRTVTIIRYTVAPLLMLACTACGLHVGWTGSPLPRSSLVVSGTPNHRPGPSRRTARRNPAKPMVHAPWSGVAVAVPGERGCGIAGACGIAKRSRFGSFQWSGSVVPRLQLWPAQPDRSQAKGFQRQAWGQTPMMSTSTQVTGSGCLIMPAPARVWVLFREVHAVRYVRQRTSRCRLQHLLSRLHGQDRLVAQAARCHPGSLLLAWPLESRIRDVRIARCQRSRPPVGALSPCGGRMAP